MATDLKAWIAEGNTVESRADMNEEYYRTLRDTLIIVGDTELLSVFALRHALDNAPNLNAKITALAIMQDEIGHAHIAYRLLADLGEDIDALVYEREPRQFKHPYAFDFAYDGSWAELAVFNAFFDRAGFVLLGDAYANTSYGPWKRALAKVDKEELFHVRNGEVWMRTLMENEETRADVQRAVDWMFPLAVEFFGLPDNLKTRNTQLEYRIKGSTNDQLRQKWLREVVPFCESIGVRVPAHYDEEKGEYVLDYPFPCHFDEEAKQWRFDQPCTWDDVIARFKRRGPKCEEFVAELRKGYRELARLREAG
ncbi:MAG TPA: Phenylacetic acid catabolic protein [Calditerricola sp.]